MTTPQEAEPKLRAALIWAKAEGLQIKAMCGCVLDHLREHNNCQRESLTDTAVQVLGCTEENAWALMSGWDGQQRTYAGDQWQYTENYTPLSVPWRDLGDKLAREFYR